MNKVLLRADVVLAAWTNWCNYFDDDVHWTMFADFLDPVRQFDLGQMEDTLVNEQTYRRAELLAGPHWYAYLKANPEQLERAKTSWGKSWRT